MAGGIDAIVMASGSSTRFGSNNKLLYPFDGIPIARKTLALICDIPEIETVYFVHSAPEVGALADGLRAVAIQNAAPHRGACESIRLGVNASCADYYLFVPCDQPLLDKQSIQAVLSAHEPGKIVVPCFGQRQGNPALFSKSYRQQLLSLKDGEHPRQIKQQHKENLIQIELQSIAPLLDGDTPQAMEELHQLWQASFYKEK